MGKVEAAVEADLAEMSPEAVVDTEAFDLEVLASCLYNVVVVVVVAVEALRTYEVALLVELVVVVPDSLGCNNSCPVEPFDFADLVFEVVSFELVVNFGLESVVVVVAVFVVVVVVELASFY